MQGSQDTIVFSCRCGLKPEASAMVSMVLDPFQILLNNLSNELHERNLQSLIHVCGELIPGGQRERISSGWDIFSILRHQNVIGSEPKKMVNLLLIIKELKPKRRDLVNMIKRHVQECYEQPEVILQDFESSDSNLPFPVISSRSSTPIPQEDCCRILTVVVSLVITIRVEMGAVAASP